VNQKVKAIFKLRGKRDREELAHCAVLTVSVEEFSHVQYSALPSVEWQQRGRKHKRVNQKVRAIFKLRGKRDREELAHCAVLTMPVEEFSHVQYSALLPVEWQQRGRKHGRSFARLHHRRTTWRIAVSLDRRSETCGNSPSYVDSVWTEHHESTKGL